jgi:hypothetical protein
MDEEAKFKLTDSSGLFTNGTPITFKKEEYDCPECGVVCCYISITLDDPTLDGMYCQRCYARWVNKNLPRITKRG